MDEWAASTDSDLLHWPMYERCRALLAAGRGDVAEARRWGGRAESQAAEWASAGTGSRRPEPSAWSRSSPRTRPRRRACSAPCGSTRSARASSTPAPSPSDRTWSRPWSSWRSTPPRARSSGGWPSSRSEQDHPWARLGAQRATSLIDICADAYTDAAGRVLEAAASSYRELGLAFDSARTLLALGRAQRRAKKWGAARDVLERAAAAFDAMGSPGWADDTRAELERVGARRSASAGGLTATERRVAELAVDGLANKEIARVLVVTVNTVEFHLRNTYAKLGIRSRVQLAEALKTLDDPLA